MEACVAWRRKATAAAAVAIATTRPTTLAIPTTEGSSGRRRNCSVDAAAEPGRGSEKALISAETQPTPERAQSVTSARVLPRPNPVGSATSPSKPSTSTGWRLTSIKLSVTALTFEVIS